MYHQTFAQSFLSLRTLLVRTFKSCTKAEPYKVTLCRVLALIMFAAPVLVHAEPLVRSAERTTQKSIAKLNSLRSKTVATNAARPVAEKAMGIDEWMAESKSETNNEVSRPTSNLATPAKPPSFESLNNWLFPFKMFPAMTMFQAGNSLKMGASGASTTATGPSTTAQSVTLYENGTIAYTPTTTVTYTISNQQFGAGTVQGLPANSAINFGGSGNGAADSPLASFALYPLMNGISGPTNAMFTACNSCTTGTSINVAADRAISLNLMSDALINSANANLQPLNSRVYYGDITISFNHPVSNPVLQFVGMGGQGSYGISTTTGGVTTTKSYDMGFATEFDLVGSNVTLSKLAGNSVLNVTSTSITNTATNLGASSAGAAVNGITRTAASGTVLATGNNITSITLKMYLRGDGGASLLNSPNGSTTWVPTTPDAGWGPRWAIASAFLPATPPATVSPGSISGDTFLLGASIQKPVTVSGAVFNDTNGLSDSIINGTGTNAGGVNAILVDSNGKVVDSVAVAANGTYSFLGIGEGSYTVRLSTIAGTQGATPPAVSLPAPWSVIGEGTAAAGDGTPDGSTTLTIAPGVNATGVNFAIGQPSLSLVKTNPASFSVGTAANYTLTISNAANRPATGTSVVVNDKLPPNFAYNSAAAGTGATGATCVSSGTIAAGLDLVCTLTTTAGIAGGGTAAFTINATPQTAAGGVAGINKAAVNPAGGTPVAPSTCTATGTPAGCALAPSITPTATPVVAGYKSVKLTTDIDSSGSITPGDTLTYTLQYANTGTIAVPAFQLNDQIPSGFIISATGGQTVTVTGAGTTATKNASYTGAAAGTVSDLLAASAALGVGGVITVTIPVIVTSAASGTKSNQVSGTGTGLSSAVLTDNAGVTADLPATVTAAPYNLTVPASSITQTITATIDPTTVSVAGIDFGDAPSNLSTTAGTPSDIINMIDASLTNTYNTVLSQTQPAARHIIDNIHWLGATVTAEANGQPDFNANLDSGDDGVTFPMLGTTRVLLSGQSNTLTVNASASGILNAWVDWNQNGVWETTEQIALDQSLSAGNNTVSFTVPNTAPHGVTYARFRFGTQTGLQSTGVAINGEVEDYKVNILLPEPGACGNGLLNGGFELAASQAFLQSLGANVFSYREAYYPGWSFRALDPASTAGATTPFDDRNSVEIWSNGSNGVPAFAGSFFAEVNAYVAGDLYQDIQTTPGTTFTWQFAHRGRAGNDTLQLKMGAPGSTVQITQVTTGNTAWQLYSGTYTVPGGQNITRLEFEAVSSAGGAGTGNFIDGISFSVNCPPVVAGYKSVKLTTDADSSSTVTPGDTLTYTLQYVNTGTVTAATSFQINDPLPAGLTITGAGNQTVTVTGAGTTATKNTAYTGAATGAVSDLLATSATVAPGGAIIITIPVTVTAGATGTKSNQASATGTGLSAAVLTDNAGATADLPASVTAAPYSLTVPAGSIAQTIAATIDPTAVTIAGSAPLVVAFKSVKLTTDADSSGSATAGDTLTYTVQYANTATVDVTSFQIADQLPTGLTITAAGAQTITVNGTGTAATKDATYTGAAVGTSMTLASGATLAQQGTITVTIPVTINAGFTGSLSNQASGSGTGLSSALLTDNVGATADLPAAVTAAPYNLTVPASSVAQTITAALDPTTLTVAGLPTIALVKTVTPAGDQPPGTDLTYKIVFSNTGGAAAQKLIIFDPIPDNTDFKLGSETITPGTTGLTMVAEFSNDFVVATPATATWTYVPASGGGGAPAGYDRNVKAVRWRVTAGNLSQTPPNHTGDAGFTVKIR